MKNIIEIEWKFFFILQDSRVIFLFEEKEEKSVKDAKFWNHEIQRVLREILAIVSIMKNIIKIE